MKIVICIAFILFSAKFCFAQAGISISIDTGHVQYMYNNDSQAKELSYNYSNKWDFDGDKKNDSLFFIGVGGAHAWFYPRIILSTDRKQRDFKLLQIDMPYCSPVESLAKWDKNPGVQFVVSDFNHDDIPDIYINFNDPSNVIPKT